jgi:hypothetical protein
MPWTPAASNRFYRLLVRAGLFLRWLFGIRLLVTGQENLPDGKAGAVVAITHFGYLDFAAAELVFWAHNRGQLRFMIHQGAADHWLAGPFINAAGQVVVPHGRCIWLRASTRRLKRRGSAGRSRRESTPPRPAFPWRRSRATGGCRRTWAAVPSPRRNAEGSMPQTWRGTAVVLPEQQRPLR